MRCALGVEDGSYETTVEDEEGVLRLYLEGVILDRVHAQGHLFKLADVGRGFRGVSRHKVTEPDVARCGEGVAVPGEVDE